MSLLAPVQRPRAIFGIGLNYAAHAAETGKDLPEQPMVFLKLPSSSVSPNGTVEVPAAAGKRLDYEVELVLVLGAENRIAGYAVANDLSARDLQGRETQWARAKGFDSSCPWGPWITTADEVADPEALRLSSQVNGEVRQDSSTSDLVFGPQALVDWIAQTCTLEPGDIILTGTPEGVGQSMDPPQFLASGRRRAARGRGPRRDRAHDRDRELETELRPRHTLPLHTPDTRLRAVLDAAVAGHPDDGADPAIAELVGALEVAVEDRDAALAGEVARDDGAGRGAGALAERHAAAVLRVRGARQQRERGQRETDGERRPHQCSWMTRSIRPYSAA